MDWSNLVRIFLQAVLDIAERHRQETGEVITVERAEQLLAAEIASGRLQATQWFLEKGRPLPE